MNILLIFLLIFIFSCEKKTDEIKIIDNISIDEKQNDTNKNITIEVKEDIENISFEKKEDIKEEKETSNKKLIMFHNGKGPMCLDQLDFLNNIKRKYPSLIIEEHLTTDRDTMNLLSSMTSKPSRSEGVSSSFGYLPITFINNHAYSGFDDNVKNKLTRDIEEICK